jgi:polyisoprenoid-binding protein YceI
MALPSRRAVVVAILLLVIGAGIPAGADLVRLRIDPAASALTFHATSRLVNADGRFHRFDGSVSVDPRDPTTARVSVTVDATSIDTDNTKRDNHLRSQDFFWAERYPTIVFESMGADGDAGGVAVLGRLTIRGVTRDIRVPTTVELSPDGFVARGQFDLKRSDYDMTYQSRLNPVGDVVRVSFVFRGVREGAR